MTEGPDIQHKAKIKGSLSFEAGCPVPIVEPDIFFDEPPPSVSGAGPATNLLKGLDAEQLLDAIIDGARDRNEIAGRAVVLAMILNRPTAPKSQTEFALLMDMPRTSAQRFWTRILQCFQESLCDSRAGRPIGDRT